MILLILTIVLLIISVIGGIVFDDDRCKMCFIPLFLLSILYLFILLFHCEAPKDKAVLEEEYKAITYKLESENCRDEFGMLNKEIVDEIQEWNEKVITGKAEKKNALYGLLIPDIYSDFETIDYEEFEP